MLRTQRKFKTVNDIGKWAKSNRENISILKVKRKYWRSSDSLLSTWRTIYYKAFETKNVFEWDTYTKGQRMIIGKVMFFKDKSEWAQCHGKSAGCEINMKASIKKLLYDELIIEMLDSIKVS